MKTVSIVGYGTMGRAIAGALGGRYKVIGLDQGDDLERVSGSDFVILAVKPQSFDELSPQLRPFLDGQTVISIMAGVRCERIRRELDIDAAVRTMPNLGLSEGRSTTAAYVSGETDKRGVIDLLELWGPIIWLNEEDDFDGFTAIAGCGPAYFFELVRQLQLAACELGFEPDVAQTIANGTLAAAAAMLDDNPADERIRQVASKGGATQAALQVFKERHLDHIVEEAVTAARDRSRELS